MNKNIERPKNWEKDMLKHINKEINFDNLLHNFGPEGLYLISDKLKKIADEHIQEAYQDSVRTS